MCRGEAIHWPWFTNWQRPQTPRHVASKRLLPQPKKSNHPILWTDNNFPIVCPAYRFLVFSLSHSMLRFASPNDFHQTKQCRNFQYSGGTIVSNHGFGYGLYYWHRRRFEAPWGCPFRPCSAMRFGCTLLDFLSPFFIEISMFTGRLASTGGLLITGSGELCCGIVFYDFFLFGQFFLAGWRAFDILTTWLGTTFPSGYAHERGRQAGKPRRSCRILWVSAIFNGGFPLGLASCALYPVFCT